MSTSAEIMQLCNEMGQLERLKILRYLLQKNMKIIEAGDGSRVNLSKLSISELSDLAEFSKSIHATLAPPLI
jgi:hypothetical protein